MSADKSAKQSSVAASVSPFSISSEWAKPFIDVPLKIYSEQLGFAARCLRSEANYLQGLADCKDVGEMFTQQFRFLQDAAQEFSKEGTRAWKVIQDASWFLVPSGA